MFSAKALLKAAAVGSSLCIASAFVTFRAGAFTPRGGDANALEKKTIPAMTSGRVTLDYEMLPGSKSYDGVGRNAFKITDSGSIGEEKPQPQKTSTPAMLPGSKSSPFKSDDIEGVKDVISNKLEATPQSTLKPQQ